MSSGYCTKLGTEHCSIIRIVLCGTTFTLLKERCQCFVDAPMLRSHRRQRPLTDNKEKPQPQFFKAFIGSGSKVRRMVFPGWSNRSWMQATIMVNVFLTVEVLRCFREVSFAQPIIKSHPSFLLRSSVGSPTSIVRALLVPFV